MISKHYTVALILLVAPLLVAFGSAVECGATPTDGCDITQNTTFNTGVYNLPNGVDILASNIVVNCNGSTLNGDGGSGSSHIGVDLTGINGNDRIIHCNLANYTYGIYLVDNNIFFGGNSNHLINNNTFYNNTYGIYIADDVSATKITNNTFKNNSHSGVFIFAQDATNSLIWNNTVYDKIRYRYTGDHEYVVDGIGNTYLDGAIGPTSEGLYIYDELNIDTTRDYIPQHYSARVNLVSSNVVFDCKGSILNGTGLFGTGNYGVDLSGVYTNLTVKNCILTNFQEGIFFQGNFPMSGGTTNSRFINNTIKASMDGIDFVSNARLNNFTFNTFINNTRGILIGGSVNNKDNKFWNNNFINNTLSASDLGINNTWNYSFEGGNYYSNFDSFSEGCSDTNNDLRCDLPYNISGAANSKDYEPFIYEGGWLLGPQASQPLPIQVISEVDMVKGKTTLIRVPITFTSVLSNDTITPNVTVYWNGTFVGQNLTASFTYNETKNIDFWYVPQVAGNNQQIRVDVNGTSANGISYFDSNTKTLGVIETRTFKVDFIAVDEKNSTFAGNVSDNVNFLNATYPLANNDLITRVNSEIFASSIGSTLENDERSILLKNLYKKGRLSVVTDRVVGIVPRGWFSAHGAGELGFAEVGTGIINKAALIEEGFRHTATHELSHTLGLCDEYSQTAWAIENQHLSLIGGCPNGDSNNDEVLDSACLDGSIGCDTQTIGKVVPWNNSDSSITLFNFMGSANDQNSRWVSKESYQYLADKFSSSSSILSVDFGILISGVVDKNGTINIDDYSYVLNEQSLINESLTGNYTLTVNSTVGSVYTLKFEPQFLTVDNGGNVSESNVSAFSFVVPFNYNVTSIQVKKNTTSSDQVNRTLNIPSIHFLTNLSNSSFSNELFNVSWNASDNDLTPLAYAVLFSADNGFNYTTLKIDYASLSLELNSSQLPDCQYCKIKILVTDGINTNYTVSESFSIDNDLSITALNVVYQNNTERIIGFNINNTFNLDLSNIFWSLDTGENIIYSNSSFNLTLTSGEEAAIYVYYNYTASGNYSLIATAYNDQYLATKILDIMV